MVGMEDAIDRPGELYITIRPVDSNGSISLYHAGLGLIAIQRLINRSIEIGEQSQLEMGLLIPERRKGLFLLTFEEVHASDLHIKAKIAASLLQALSPFEQNLAITIIGNVISGLILKGLDLKWLPAKKIEIDPSMLPSWEELASAGVAGKITFELRNGQYHCSVDQATYDKIKELKNLEMAGSEGTAPGVVVGSNMDERRIEIRFDVFGKTPIPCYYQEEQAHAFRRYTKDGTKVIVTGDFVYVDDAIRFVPPAKIWLRSIRPDNAKAHKGKQNSPPVHELQPEDATL